MESANMLELKLEIFRDLYDEDQTDQLDRLRALGFNPKKGRVFYEVRGSSSIQFKDLEELLEFAATYPELNFNFVTGTLTIHDTGYEDGGDPSWVPDNWRGY